MRARSIAGVRSRRDSATRFVIAIVTVGLVAFLVVLVSGVAVVRNLAETQAIEQARSLTLLDARLVQRRVTDAMADPGNVSATGSWAPIVDPLLENLSREVVRSPAGGLGPSSHRDVPSPHIDRNGQTSGPHA